ncbi:MAG: sensor histidine kinase [bacterium]
MGGTAPHRRTVRALRSFPVLYTSVQLHTIANTLSAAGALLRRRPEAAEDLLAQLARYLRDLLGVKRPLVPLADELRLALTFIGVERARMGGRLRLEVACTPESLATLIPPLVLHPLVENAVQHGIARRPVGGRIRILGRTAGGILHLVVADDGPGMRRTAPSGRASGWGLIGVRLRLLALWGPSARLRILCGPTAGTIAAISLPSTAAPFHRSVALG